MSDSATRRLSVVNAALVDDSRVRNEQTVAPAQSFLSNVAPAPVDAIFGLSARYRADPSTAKVDLIIGAYRDEAGKPWVLPSVRASEERLLSQNLNHEYQPIEGSAQFRALSAALVFGEGHSVLSRTATVQSISGTGALAIGASFLAKTYPSRKIYISNPTWANHVNLFDDHRIPVGSYRYFDKNTRSIDFEGMMEDLRAADNGAIVLFHACAHNPTGADPSMDQWRQLSQLVKEKEFFVFFDSAYQGFASGDLDHDARAIRFFVKEGHPMLLAQSFAKNMGLYGERCGALHAVCPDPQSAQNVFSQFQRIIRSNYSNPPSFGVRIAAMILSDPTLLAMWKQDIKTMSSRISEMRTMLYQRLLELKTPGSWVHIINQIGMFTFTGLTAKQCEVMIEKHHVYLTSNGRISVAGLTRDNVNHVAEAINDVVINVTN